MPSLPPSASTAAIHPRARKTKAQTRMIDKSIIGKEYPPFTVEVEKRWVRSFAEAIGETSPIYFEESVASAAGYRSLPTPPTFPFAMIMDGNQSFMILDELGIDKRRAMHGEPVS